MIATIKCMNVNDIVSVKSSIALLKVQKLSPAKEKAYHQALSMSLDKHLIQLKAGSRQIADRLIALFDSTACSGIRLKLVNHCAQFWCSPNFNRIASATQLRYVTYLLYTMLIKAGPSTAFQD